MTTNKIISTTVLLFVFSLSLCAQDAPTLWEQAISLQKKAVEEKNYNSLAESIKLMEKAYKYGKADGDKAYDIGSAYYCPWYFNFKGEDKLRYVDREKGIKWFEISSNLGKIEASLILYDLSYKDLRSFTYYNNNILYYSRKDLRRYNNLTHKCERYAYAALSAEIPLTFEDYLGLAKAASFIGNSDLAGKYAAKAVDNEESGAIDYILDKSIAMGYITSAKDQFKIGIKLWQRGNSEKNDHEKGFELLEKSAKAGYADAQKKMGDIYITGPFVAPDTLKAMAWYKLAAQGGNAKAMYSLGKIYELEQDSLMAFTMIRESAENGYTQAKWNLGFYYHFGFGTIKDQSKARENFETFRGKYTNVDYFIGLTYYAESSPKAIPLFEKCLEIKAIPNEQRADIFRKLSKCYRHGYCGVSIDLVKANDLKREAEKYGDPEISDIDILKFINVGTSE